MKIWVIIRDRIEYAFSDDIDEAAVISAFSNESQAKLELAKLGHSTHSLHEVILNGQN